VSYFALGLWCASGFRPAPTNEVRATGQRRARVTVSATMGRLRSEQVLRDINDGDPSSVTALNLSLRALSDVSCLRDFQNLGRLDLSCNGLTSLEGLSSCINLKWLSVAQNKLKSLRGIEGLSKLTVGNKDYILLVALLTFYLDCFFPISSLRWLFFLYPCDCTTWWCAHVLNASKNMLLSMDVVRSLTELRALILNDNEISSICNLDQLKYLNTLVLSRNPIHDIGSSLKNSSSIVKLSLSKCKIQVIGSSLIFSLNLKELRLSDNEITSLPVELVRNIKLQNLDLGKNLIMRLSDLKVLSELHNLKNLNLQGNPISENPKLIKKIRKLVPNLQIFNAKPIERWNQSKKLPEDISVPKKGDRFPEDTTAFESEEKVKSSKPRTDTATSGKKTKKRLGTTDNTQTHALKDESKTKKPKVGSHLTEKVIASINDDENFPVNADDAKEKEVKKESTTTKGGSKPVEFDDGETSFMELILSEDATGKAAGKPRGLMQPSWDEKLLGGMVVDLSKKMKAKNSRRGPSVHQTTSLHVPAFGEGGASTWG
ncbi:hypothetical protein Taro_032859, partial [Colocasia esculenta]|nr:hypothetical protein [Colocasia esculenta]